VVDYLLPEMPAGEESQELWVMFESIVLAVGVWALVFPVLLMTFLVLKVWLRTEWASELWFICPILLPLEVTSICGSVLVEIVLSIPVLNKLVVCGLIEGVELAPLPRLKLLLCLLITFIHILVLSAFLLVSGMLGFLLSLVQVVKVFLWEGIPLSFCFDTWIGILELLKFFLNIPVK